MSVDDLSVEKKLLYAAFLVPPPADISGPEPYEMTEHEKRFLLRQPLDDLTAEHLHNFIFNIGVIQWPSIIYFMPRLIEITLSEQLNESDVHSVYFFLDSVNDKLTEKQRTGLRQYGEVFQKKRKKRGHIKGHKEFLKLFLLL